MPHYQSSELAKKQLLADVYAGNNIADHHKREKSKQQTKFEKMQKISGINLLEEFLSETDVTGVLGRSFLTHIINAYNKPALKWALQQEPTIVNHYFDGEQHPLLRAAELGSKEMVKMLIDAGANPNLIAYKISPSDRLQALRSIGKRNVYYETVGAAIQADLNINQGIKNMVSQAITKINLQDATEVKPVAFSDPHKSNNR